MREQIAIIGANASGKSTVARDMELKGHNVSSVTFSDAYGVADPGYFHQQRWNSCEYDSINIHTVRERLGVYQDDGYSRRILDIFAIEDIIDKPEIQLSSGEHRRFQLARRLLRKPETFIIDNPYIGLDARTRDQLDSVLGNLVRSEDIQLIMLQSQLGDVPEWIDSVIPVADGVVGEKVSREVYLADFAASAAARKEDFTTLMEKVRSFPTHDPGFDGEEVLKLRQVSISYGDKTILAPLDWTVNKGERWALKGLNGSGKSTLLSIICADIPQAYACDVTLFGRGRGTGESIWDIKKHIGYVSPELHRGYIRDVPAIDIVASGLHDRAGLYVKTSEEHLPACEFWMDVFGVLGLRDRSFVKMSFGEQRLVLLARAFVKDPELLILDEPMHGLDTWQKDRVRHIVEAFCSRPDKTLIMVSHYDDEFPPVMTGTLTLKRP